MRRATLFCRTPARSHAGRSNTRYALLSNGNHTAQARQIHEGTRSSAPDILSVLFERGLIKDIAGDRPKLSNALQQRQIGFYAGIDPTAPSLHLGHLLPLMVLFWLYVHGHHTISLIGGATAQVGDPSGRLTTRTKTEQSTQVFNTQALQEQVDQIWERAEAYGLRHGYKKEPSWKRTLLNNADWLMNLNIVDFLKQLGSSMRIGTMLSRDTVKNKLEKGDGMSFAEFTYPLLQGWDWWHMFKHHGIQVQVGGSDQYGNIVAGIDAVKHCSQSASSTPSKLDMPPMGLTTPLLTTTSGAKFGKSAGNAIWLNADMTTPFDLYGFLLRTTDEDVERYLKLFTFLPLNSISATMQEHQRAPEKRQAQHLLASEVSELVHGAEEAVRTAESHKSMRAPNLAAMLQSVGRPLSDTAAQAESMSLPVSLARTSSFAKLLHHAGLVTTTSEGSRLVKSGGLYAAVSGSPSDANALRFVQVTDEKPADIPTCRDSNLLILRLGKWKVKIIQLLEDERT